MKKEEGFGQPESQLSLIQKNILKWKGEIVVEDFELQQVKEEELLDLVREQLFGSDAQMTDDDMEKELKKTLDGLKENWLINFIDGEGFQLLMNLQQQIVTSQTGLENELSLMILRLVTSLIKIILTAAFSAQSKDEVLVNKLQRKMSSHHDPEEIEEVKKE